VAVAVLDASVFIAYLDPDDAHHASSVAALRESETLVLPASAYAEILVYPYERGPAVVRHVESAIAELPVEIEPTGVEIARRAAELRAKKRVRLPDALVIATGDFLGADVVLTADRRWRRLGRQVRVV
jgi:predicted nucleic acid-binding protein